MKKLDFVEAWFLRMVADAAAICSDVDSPGVTCKGDFWHMTWEETDDKEPSFRDINNLFTFMWPDVKTEGCPEKTKEIITSLDSRLLR